MKKYYNPEMEIVMISAEEDVLTLSVQNLYSGFGSNEENAEGVWNW